MTILDYLEHRGDLLFEQDAFGDVDNEICAQLSILDFSSCVSTVPGEETPMFAAIERYFEERKGQELYLGALMPEGVFDMARRLVGCKRFEKTRLTAFRYEIKEGQTEEEQKQWTAVTFLFEDQTMYIAFAGTDDTLISWKENLNMALLDSVPSQNEAAAYVADVLRAYPDYQARVGGHSKGGNLAVFAAAKCGDEAFGRIFRVYDNDGPGFSNAFIEDPDYKAVRGKVRNILPELSVVGLLLERDLPFTLVKSSAKGVFQHDCFSWNVIGNRFEEAKEPAKEALLLRKMTRQWLSGLSSGEKTEFVEAFYKLLTATDAKTLTDLFENKLWLFTALRRLPREDRKAISGSVRKFIKAMREVLTSTASGEAQGENVRFRTKEGEFVKTVDGASLYDSKTVKKKKK